MKPLPWRNALVFAAHGDDEIIGCGGTIARLKAQRARVTVAVFTSGDTSYATPGGKATIVKARLREMAACDRVLKIDRRINLGRPTQGVVNDRETYQDCVRIIRETRPDVIFTHAPQNKHRDHRAVCEASDEARWKASERVLADLGKPWTTPELYFYENHELFAWPSIVVDITPFFKTKLRAMRTQTTQLDVLESVFDRLEGVGKARGYRGGGYGEAFQLSNFMARRL